MSESKKKYSSALQLVVPMLVMPWLLSACATVPVTPSPMACTSNCRVNITLPEQAKRPPQVPQDQVRYPIAGNTKIKFIIAGPPATAETILVFEGATALVDEDGNELYSVKLGHGPNKFTTNKPGSCPGETCKYSIVNVGCPTCPVLDPWIIIE